MKQLPIVLGVDVGTSGVRLSAVDLAGAVAWTRSVALDSAKPTPAGVHEQEPAHWWDAICRLTCLFMKERLKTETAAEIHGLCVTSTSGTLVATDQCGVPVRPAVLYDDQRPSSAAAELNIIENSHGPRWNASHSLTKAIWLRNEEPQAWSRVRRLLHPTDWITGKLSGDFGIADHSNALKLGYESDAGCWHSTIEKAGIASSMLPTVVPPGKVLGKLCLTAIQETGLPAISVVAGATDGIAGLIASGATNPGDANTTLGTTLVWKVLSATKPVGCHSSVYSHLHPSGLWAPGAASNAGPGSLQLPDGIPSPIEALDQAALGHLPCSLFCYPISGKGERFPFVNSTAQPFTTNAEATACERYASQLQAIAFIERWGYEVLEQCGVSVGRTVFSTGGAASSDPFCQLRASVLKRRVGRCPQSNAAFGASILAAAGVQYRGDLLEAIRQMTRRAIFHDADHELQRKFDDIYGEFRKECDRRGYS